MAKFYTGQRVKIVRIEGLFADWLGREATIAGPSFVGEVSGWTCYPLDVDGLGKKYVAEWKLEPLVGPAPDAESFQRFMDTLLRTDTPLVMYARALDMAGTK